MSQNREISGRFQPGTSGNPGGRPRGLARATREIVGVDGLLIIEFWLGVMLDVTARPADRLEASQLLADRGWGKAAVFQPIEEDDQLGLKDEAYESAFAKLEAEVARITARQADES